MDEATPYLLGDPCPSCGGALEAALVPTPAQREAAEDKEKRTPLPHRADTASARQREDLGALYRCTRCPYETRVPLGDVDRAFAGAGR